MSRNMDTDISIIIPAYNSGKYITETLDSINRQTYRGYEIIIINDGSTDDTDDIVKKYIESRKENVKYFIQPNMGQSAARNKGIDAAECKYVMFIDSDDIIDDDYLEVLHNTCIKNDADVIICGYQCFDDKTGAITEIRNPIDWEVEFSNEKSFVFQYSPCAKIFRRDFLREYNIRFSEGEQYEDAPFGVVTNILAKRSIAIEYLGYQYRIRSDSTVGKTKKGDSTISSVPFNGIESAIKIVLSKAKEEDRNILEYCIVKLFAGFTTTVLIRCNKDDRKIICDKVQTILNFYFPNAWKNPYSKIHKLNKLPLVHKIAVKIFLLAYKFNHVFEFSLLFSKVSNIIKRN